MLSPLSDLVSNPLYNERKWYTGIPSSSQPPHQSYQVRVADTIVQDHGREQDVELKFEKLPHETLPSILLQKNGRS